MPDFDDLLKQYECGPFHFRDTDIYDRHLAFDHVIPPEQAMEKALAARPGTIVDADVDRKFRKHYYEVEIVDAQGVEWEVDIDAKTGFETRNLLAVPMRTKERVIGAIEVINRKSGSFDDRDLGVASALANQAAIAIDNARLYARLADAVVTSRMSYRL